MKLEVIDKTILDNFYKLVHEQSHVRLRAATSTFKILNALQKDDEKFNENLNYCVDRLVTGLSSARAQARKGFSVLLLEILKHHKITTAGLFAISDKKFGPIHKDTSKDELLGHYLLTLLIIESGNASKNKVSQSPRLYRNLINLHKTKSYFDLPVCESLKKHLDIFYPLMLEDIPKGAFEPGSKNTPLDLMIISLCNSKQPIKEFIGMDNSKIEQIISTLRLHNLKSLPLHPLVISMFELFTRHWSGHFVSFWKEVVGSQADIMKELIKDATQETLVTFIDILVGMFVKSSDKDRESICHLLTYAIRRPSMVEQPATVVKVVKVFMINGIFGSKRYSVKNAFHSSLECLISICNPTQRVQMLNSLLDTVKTDYFKVNEHKELWTKFNWEWTSQRDILMNDTKHKHLSSIASLYLLYGLQVIDHEMDCEKQLEELKEATNDVIKGDPSDGSWADILTDQIIAVLSATECDPWVRNLCEKVFGTLLPHISQTSIDLLCDALAPHEEEDSEGGSDDGSSSDSQSSDDDDDDDDGEDEEEEILVDHEQDKDSLGSEGNEKSSDISSEVDENPTSDPAMEVDEESSEEYLDDEQMMKYDKVLAEMFKLRRLDRKKDSVSIGFKLRLLDLVKRILKKRNKDQETISLLVSAIIPLAKSCRSSKESMPIYTKVKGILSKMPAKARYPEVAKFLEK